MSLHSTTSNCQPAKNHLRRTIVDELLKAGFRGIESAHVMLVSELSLSSSDGSGVVVSVGIQSAIGDYKSVTENLLSLDNFKGLLNADLRVAIELGEEWQVLVEEWHAEQTLLADELSVLAGELLVRHCA